MKTPGQFIRAAVLGGIVGNITISIYLCIVDPLFFHVSPLVLFQWDASNIIGEAAFGGGGSSAALGFFFDFIVAGLWSTGFVMLYRAVPAVRRSVKVSGLLFGAFVMLAMFNVVVPLGRAQHPSSHLPALFSGLIAHTVFFGLPVALTVRQSLRRAANGA